jgi:hypothetical protein
MTELADWRTSLGVSTFNSLSRVGFADGWATPLRAGPHRHPLLDKRTSSEFIKLDRDPGSGRLARVGVKEVYAWDLAYRSDIYATGFSFTISLRDRALEMLTEKARVGEFNWMDDSILCSFALRVPVRREFAFPEPRASQKPYSEGPSPTPLRQVATVSADWIEVAALDSKRIHYELVEELPISDLFADAGPIRLFLGEK